MPTDEYRWPFTLLIAGTGGFVAWCIAMLLYVLVHALLPVRIPLWATTILAFVLVTYFFTGFAEGRINTILGRRTNIAGVAEDPSFPIDDPRRTLPRQFYTLREADKWMTEQEARGAINGSFRDVRLEDENDERVLYPAIIIRPDSMLVETFRGASFHA